MQFSTSRARVRQSLAHKLPDQTPVDFLSVSEVWNLLAKHFDIPSPELCDSDFFNPAWETVLQKLHVDCRVISYDQFCTMPERYLQPGGTVSWWDSYNRSTPNRMWRQITPDGKIRDIWGHIFKSFEYPYGWREELAEYPLHSAVTIHDLQSYSWPDPDWWDFSGLPELLTTLDEGGEKHIRYRVGSVFEMTWQLFGMEDFFIRMAEDPDIPCYVMEKLTDIQVEVASRAIAAADHRIDMLYFYDDVATQRSLLVSKAMWHKYIRPYHQRIAKLASENNMPVMYHCDGAIRSLIPDLLEMGISVLNPVQGDAVGMEFERLKEDFGEVMTFHGGVDINHILPHGNSAEIHQAVKNCVDTLGKNGGYILAGTHHIQANTPIQNIEAMYQIDIR